MAKQWVDITTIDNNTPFTKVRWIGSFSDDNGDKWFSEEPGIVSDGMGWTDGKADKGWFSAHRMNDNAYTCSFMATGNSFFNNSTIQQFGVECSNKGRSMNGWYDTAVTIDGTTYYEVDFSSWSGATNKNLYAPYSAMPWTQGEVLVEVDVTPPTPPTPSSSTLFIGTEPVTAMYLGTEPVKGLYIGDVAILEPEPAVDWTKEFLTFKITSSGNIRWVTSNASFTKTIAYSKDSGTTWSALTSSIGSQGEPFTGGTLLQVSAGDVVMFRGQDQSYGGSTWYNAFEGSDAGFEICGNLMSMIYGYSFTGQTEFPSSLFATHVFRNFLSICTGMTSMENLVFPTNTLDSAFRWFAQHCTSLTKGPVLSADTLTSYCYARMFRGCTSINYVKCLATTNVNTTNTSDWFLDANTTGTFVKKAGVNWDRSVSGIPSGWTVVEE